MRTWFPLVVVLLSPVLLGAEGRVTESCGTCHPEVQTEYGESIHAQSIGCTGCHGGDPTVTTLEAHSVAKGYIGKPDRKDIPALCASCHADPTKMKPYELPTDQYAQYQTSGHGLHLAQGDTRVAVCTDCHGKHRIVPPSEPTSPVYPTNIPATCGHCHSDATLMAQYNLPADAEQKFRSSVHGAALLVDQHPSAPSCATCHGAHGAIAPQVGSIKAVCGHCHARTREYFNESPHRRVAENGGQMSECVSCHGYHDTSHPDSTLFDTACGSCHPQDSVPFATGQQLKTILNRANEAVEAAAAEMARAEPQFPTVARYQARLQQARANFLEALPVQHSLAVARVDDLTRSARSIAEDVQASVLGVEQQEQARYLGLAVAWVLILFIVGVAYAYNRERRRARAAEDDSGPR